MKKLLLPFLFFLPTLLSAQNYKPLLDSVNSWCYTGNYIVLNIPDTFLAGPCYYPISSGFESENYYTLGDTLINGTIYKPLESTDYYYNYNCRTGYIREDTVLRKVYFMDNVFSPEVVLYDFGLQLSDTITLHFYNSPGYYENGIYQLDSIKSFITATGFSTKAFYLNCPNCNFSQRTVEWIEGIGSRISPVLPLAGNYGGGGLFAGLCATWWSSFPYDYSTILTSFAHGSMLFYDSCALQMVINNPCFEYHDTCNYWLICGAIHEQDLSIAISVHPNPANRFITVTTGKVYNNSVRFTIKNLSGQLVYTGERVFLSEGKNHTLNITFLKPGIYIVECLLNNKTAFKKFVIE